VSQNTQISAAGGIPPAERQARQNGKDTTAVSGFPFQSLLNSGTMVNAPANFALRANQQIVLNLTSELSNGRETIRESYPASEESASRSARSARYESQPSDTTSDPAVGFEKIPVDDDYDGDQAISDIEAAPSLFPPKNADLISPNAGRTDVADGSAPSRAPLTTGDQPSLSANRDSGMQVSRPTEQVADLSARTASSQANTSTPKSDPSGIASQTAAGTPTSSLRVADAEQSLSQAHRTPVHISVVDNSSRLVSGPSAALLRSTDVNLQAGATAATTVNAAEGQNGTQTGGQNAGSQNSSQHGHGLPFGAVAAAQAAGAGLTGVGTQPSGEGKPGFAPTSVNALGSQNGSLQNANLSGQLPSAALTSSLDTRGTSPASINRGSATAPTPARAEPHEIGVQITRAAKSGIDRISIDLKPETLGRIEVRLDLGQDGRVSALILADSKDTLEMLRADARALQQNLQDAGLKTDGQSLQFDLRGEHGRPHRDNTQLPHINLSDVETGAGLSADELGSSNARYMAEYNPIFSDNHVNVLA